MRISDSWRVAKSWREVFKLPSIKISPELTVILAWASLAAAAVRGFDYVFLPQSNLTAAIIEHALPVALLGWMIILAVTLGASGWLSHRWPVAIIGHAVLAGAFLALGAGTIWQGTDDISGAGLRDGTGFILVRAAVHGVIVVALWREWDYARRP